MNFIDLFCGCGGFTLGMERAGFKCLAAIDFNEEAITTFKANFSREIIALRKDLSKFSPDKLAAKLGVNHVDVIVGGPPCQGFSTVRQVDAANHGSRVRRDKRRYLFRCFLDYVAAFRPRIFVMENVLGLQSAAKGKFFTMAQSEARKLGYRVQAQVEKAWTLGVPQKRRRQLIIGVRNDVPGYFPGELISADSNLFTPTLHDAIGDLPPLKQVREMKRGTTTWRCVNHFYRCEVNPLGIIFKMCWRSIEPPSLRLIEPARTTIAISAILRSCVRAKLRTRR